MKQFLLVLVCALLVGTTARAQRLQVGVRGGINFTDYKFMPVTLNGTRFSAGPSRAGYEVGFVLRLNLARHLHLQSELNYAFNNYALRFSGVSNGAATLHAERLEIPVQAGLQFGIVRLFGGVSFRVAEASRCSVRRLLSVGFNDDNLAVMGGIGLNIRKFFIDFRMQGYPRSRVWHTYSSGDTEKRVKVSHDILYGGSLGFFF